MFYNKKYEPRCLGKVLEMKQRKFNLSDYMSLQIIEIEHFCKDLSIQNRKKISFEEATMIWIHEGFAEKFRSQYSLLLESR